MLNSMILSRNEMRKTRSKKGFTLMEMLIVVAIIAILVAIAIPTFSAQLDKARIQTDAANERSAKSMAVSTYLTTDPLPTSATYYVYIDGQSNLMLSTTAISDGTEDIGQSTDHSGQKLVIVVTSGSVTSATWSDIA